MNSIDYLARACFRTPKDDRKRRESVESAKVLSPDKYQSYKRRYFILLANAFNYFFWNLTSTRHVAVVPEFALFFDTTNEFAGFSLEELGVDFLGILGALLLVFTYPIGGQLVDVYGLGTMSFASCLLALSAGWWFYLADTNYSVVVLSRVASSFAGSLNACSLLRVSNNWFPVNERPLAVAFVAIIANLGAAAGLLYGSFFADDDNAVVNDELRSCNSAFIDGLSVNETFALNNGTLACSDDAIEQFCCVAPLNMEGLNLSLALALTFMAIFTCAVVQDAPDKPPSPAGTCKDGKGTWESIKAMFKHRNYNQICLADFFCTGPIFLIFSTLERVAPPRVVDFAIPAAALGVALTIPTAIIFSMTLARKKNFYEMTAGGYSVGAICFSLITICIFIDSEFTDYCILALAVLALVGSVMWTVSVYELKIEYVFPGFAVHGAVVAVDRTIINFSSFLFLLAIPPERYTGGGIDGRQFTFIVSCFFVVLGTILAICVPNKRDYKRVAYEKEHDNTSVDNFEED